MMKLTSDPFVAWSDVPLETLNEYIQRQVVSGDQLMLAMLHMKAGAWVATHSHPNEQFTYILSGKVLFRYGNGLEHKAIVSAGELLHIPAGVPHNAKCLEDAIDLDIFTPPRADWDTDGGNNYFLAGDASAKLEIKGV
ncbi:cupin domain-containing protein [Burkholderia sp. Bp9140]|uniref:cupin domain-containing protein n=1 Tax=Burkholderia sp. Bp9140 TaxID=2184572 RepID=UPI000F58E733|nr:cupin domain-containing protein [Burkholderia sp. Bp9140]RQR43952.1 cupin domain-containing protein [Burkholderia sp. Bp9140]